ncbi:MAG: ankyrin repeat domain-containing protein [Sphaerochaetaceae bacterium]|nr:ankyrin repeat domain-containing protein [Sphaerochaetaceae bacterium]
MDYYKILNEKECHYGLKYKFGLNIDPKEFNPSGDCSPGGIYFSREDILAFLNCGIWIRKVTLPEDARVYENPSYPKKWKADRVILGKKEKITIKVIKRLIDEGADPKTDDCYPLIWATMRGYLDIVKFFISISDPKTNISEALRCAAEHGYLNIVKLLIPVSEIDNEVIEYCKTFCRNQEILDLIISNKKES